MRLLCFIFEDSLTFGFIMYLLGIMSGVIAARASRHNHAATR